MPAPAASPAGDLPLYAQLRERIRAEIVSGRLAPGARLPSEHEMTAAFGVSRITVRQALADLTREGLVTKAHGRGSFVAAAPVAQELSRLAGLAESLSGAGRTIRTQVLAHGGVAAGADEAARLNLAPGTPLTEILTLRRLNGEPLSLNRSLLPAAIGARLAPADLEHRDILAMLETDLGLSIGHADLAIGATSAGTRAQRHLDVARGAPLVHVERLVHTADGRPVHLETSDYRADRFSYRLRLPRAAAR